MRFKQATHPWSAVRRVFGKRFAGSTGDSPVPSGDSPDGTAATVRANGHGLFATLPAAVPVGGSPTGAGGSPAPPIFKTGSEGLARILHTPLECAPPRRVKIGRAHV